MNNDCLPVCGCLNTFKGSIEMNIEELKLVLETVASITDDAKSVAIWYFVFNYGAPFILTLVGMIGFGWLVWVITKAILSTNKWADLGLRVTRAWGGQSISSYYSPYTYDNLPAIEKCLAASKERK